MAEEAKTYVFGNDSNSMLPFAMNNGLGGWGGGIAGLILGLLFGGLWGGNGWGGFGGNSNGVVATEGTRDLIMSGIAGNRESIATLASTLNSDYNSVSQALASINTTLATVGSQVGMSGLQVINAVQAGDASLSKQVCESICGVNSNIINQGYEARIATIEQTNQLGSQSDRNSRLISDQIAAQTTLITKEFCELKERELQDKIDSLTAANTTLKSQIDNAQQTATITSYVNSLVTPLAATVAEIKQSIPSTVAVPYPQLSAIPTSYLYGYGYNSGSIWS